MALQGTLTEFGVADILQLLAAQKKTGLLALEQGNRVAQALVLNGKLVDAMGQDEPLILRCLNLTDEQYHAVEEQVERTGRSLKDVLLSLRLVTQEECKELMEFQVREVLLSMFEWRTGLYRFEAEAPEQVVGVVDPMPIEPLTMEGIRRVAEWPALRRRLSRKDLKFKAIKEAPPEVETSEVDDNALLDDAFAAFDDDENFGTLAPAPNPAAKSTTDSLEKNERLILSMCDGETTLEAMSLNSRLGLFETVRSLCSLWDQHYIEQVVFTAKSAKDDPKNKVKRICLAALPLLIAAIVIAFTPYKGLQNAKMHFEQLEHDRALSERVIILSHLIEVFALEQGRYPESLDELRLQGLVKEKDINSSLEYISIGTDYSLR